MYVVPQYFNGQLRPCRFRVEDHTMHFCENHSCCVRDLRHQLTVLLYSLSVNVDQPGFKTPTASVPVAGDGRRFVATNVVQKHCSNFIVTHRSVYNERSWVWSPARFLVTSFCHSLNRFLFFFFVFTVFLFLWFSSLILWLH